MPPCWRWRRGEFWDLSAFALPSWGRCRPPTVSDLGCRLPPGTSDYPSPLPLCACGPYGFAPSALPSCTCRISGALSRCLVGGGSLSLETFGVAARQLWLGLGVPGGTLLSGGPLAPLSPAPFSCIFRPCLAAGLASRHHKRALCLYLPASLAACCLLFACLLASALVST